MEQGLIKISGINIKFTCSIFPLYPAVRLCHLLFTHLWTDAAQMPSEPGVAQARFLPRTMTLKIKALCPVLGGNTGSFRICSAQLVISGVPVYPDYSGSVFFPYPCLATSHGVGKWSETAALLCQTELMGKGRVKNLEGPRIRYGSLFALMQTLKSSKQTTGNIFKMIRKYFSWAGLVFFWMIPVDSGFLFLLSQEQTGPVQYNLLMKLLCALHPVFLILLSACWKHWIHSRCFPPHSCERGKWLAWPVFQVTANMMCTTSDIYVSTQSKRMKLAAAWGHLAYKPPNHCPPGKKLETCAYLYQFVFLSEQSIAD